MLSLLLELIFPFHSLILSLLPHMQLLMYISISLSFGVLRIDHYLFLTPLGVGPYLMLIVAITVYLVIGLVSESATSIVHLR